MMCHLYTNWTGDPQDTAALVRFAMKRFGHSWWSTIECERTHIRPDGSVVKTFKRRINILTHITESEKTLIELILAGHVDSWYHF